MINNEITRGLAAILGKQQQITTRRKYYDGDTMLRIISEKLREIYKQSKFDFVMENWCKPVVDAVNNKIRLLHVTVQNDETATSALADILYDNDIYTESCNAHENLFITGSGYVIAGRDPQTGEPSFYSHKPDSVHVFYAADNPKRKTLAVKYFLNDDETMSLITYTPERIETYKSRGKRSEFSADKIKSSDWELVDDLSSNNDLGIIPVWEFARGNGEIADAIHIQDAINKLLADMMVASEFMAIPQRYIISNADTGSLGSRPGAHWDIPASDGEGQPTSVGQFDSANIQNYILPVERKINALSKITATPAHYFVNGGNVPSGEALIALEAPLNAKAEDYIQRLTRNWAEIASYLLLLKNKQVPPKNVSVVFADPKTIQPHTEAIIRAQNVSAGIPLVTELRREGWSQTELDQLIADGGGQSEINQTPEQQALQQKQIVEQIATVITPAVTEAVNTIADAAVGKILADKTLDKIVAAKQNGQI